MAKKPLLDYESAIDAGERRDRRRSTYFAGGVLLFTAASILLLAAERFSILNLVLTSQLVVPGVMLLILAAWAPDSWLYWLGSRDGSLLLCFIGLIGATGAIGTVISDGAEGWEWIAFGFWLGMSILIIILGVYWWPKKLTASDEANDV